MNSSLEVYTYRAAVRDDLDDVVNHTHWRLQRDR
jgi:hypothetical protein